MRSNRLAPLILLSALVLSDRPSAFANLTPGSQQRCADIALSDVFQQPASINRLRVLITNYSSISNTRTHGGSNFPDQLARALPAYAQKQLKMPSSGLTMANLDIQRINCQISDPGQALSIGQKTHADLVFWGQESPSKGRHIKTTKKAQRVKTTEQDNHEIKVESVFKDSPNGKSTVNINLATLPPGLQNEANDYYSNITITSHVGLSKISSTEVTFEEPQELVGLNLPHLVSRDIKLLFDFALGIFAFHTERYSLVISLMEGYASSIPAGTERRYELMQLLGRSHMLAGDLQRSESILKDALKSCPPADWACQGIQKTYLGWALIFLGKPSEARSELEDAVQYLKAAPADERGVGAALHNLGLLELKGQNYSVAQSYFSQALEFRSKANDEFGRMMTRNNLSLTKQALQDLDGAQSDLKEVNAYFRKIRSLYGIGRSANNLGLLYLKRGIHEPALRQFNAAIEASTQSGDRWVLAKAHYNLGRLWSTMGKTSKALETLEEAARIQQELRDHLDLVFTTFEIGALHHSSSRLLDAMKYYKQALSEISFLDHSQSYLSLDLKTSVQNNLCTIYFEMKDFGKAKAGFLDLIKSGNIVDVSKQADLYRNLADVLLEEHEHALAIDNLHLAAKKLHELARYRDEYMTLSRIADIHLQRARTRDLVTIRLQMEELRHLFSQTSEFDTIRQTPEEIRGDLEAAEAAEAAKERQRGADLLNNALPVDNSGYVYSGSYLGQPAAGYQPKQWGSESNGGGVRPLRIASRLQPMKLPPHDTSSPFLRYSPPATVPPTAPPRDEPPTRPAPPTRGAPRLGSPQ